MKNDYLWDKTGEDAEIEHLEDLLNGYRYVEQDPPELPAMNIISLRASWQSRFGWILTLGTTAAVFVVAVIYVQTVRLPQKETTFDVATAPPTPLQTPGVSSARDIKEAPAPTAQTGEVKPFARKTTRYMRMSEKPAPKTQVARKQPGEKITKEELYAYNQVKLALFITGSKLRTISDTIDKIENKQDVSPNKGR